MHLNVTDPLRKWSREAHISCLESLQQKPASEKRGHWETTHFEDILQEVKVKVAQSCLTLCDPMDYTVCGILQARILEWVGFPFSRGSSQLRSPTLWVDSLQAEPPGNPQRGRDMEESNFRSSESRSWSSNTLATWCEELSHWKRLWCWDRLKAGGEGDNRGWNGWMASPTRWTWVWVDSGSWWWTGRPGVLQSMRLQRVEHDWATEQ